MCARSCQCNLHQDFYIINQNIGIWRKKLTLTAESDFPHVIDLLQLQLKWLFHKFYSKWKQQDYPHLWMSGMCEEVISAITHAIVLI